MGAVLQKVPEVLGAAYNHVAGTPNSRKRFLSKSDAIKALLSIAEKDVSFDYHAPSKSHIAYYLGIGRAGVQGIGDFPRDALLDFKQKLKNFLTAASKEDVLYWYARIIEQSRIDEVKREACSGQIGLVYTQRFKRASDNCAAKNKLSVNKYHNMILEKAYSKFREDAFSLDYNDIREKIIEHDKSYSKLVRDSGEGEKYSWPLRVDPDFHARLIFLANEFDVSVPKLCRYLLECGLEIDAS